MRVEWRRTLPAPPAGDEGNAELVGQLRAEIEERGPITFARFMERALYEPGLGYYTTSAERPTRAGDFLTAPELHPIFGHVLARQLDEIWRRMSRPQPFVLAEYGAGTGALFLDVLDGLVRLDSPLASSIRYQPIDQPAQVELIGERLAAAGRGDRLLAADAQIIGCVIVNEFVDALPVHRVRQSSAGLREVYVSWADGRFVEHEGEPSDSRLVTWFEDAGVELGDGQLAEVNLAMLEWLAELDHRLERGCVLIFDYGARTAELYGAARPSGSLRAFSAHHVSGDVLAGAGTRDLTAHVDIDALERAASAARFDVLGTASQARFLLGAGLDEAYADARREADGDWDSALALRGAVRRLLDPAALGGYWAVILGRGVSGEPPLSGLADQQ